MRITVDTNFLISATQWDYSVAHKLLKELILLDVEIFTTPEILAETTEVLRRDFKYDKIKVENIIKVISSFTKLIESKQKVTLIKDEPDDNKIIECALESSSEYILTYDQHLLKINEYQGIRIIRPEEARAIF